MMMVMLILQGDMHCRRFRFGKRLIFWGFEQVDVIYDVLEMIDKDYQYIAPQY